MIGGGSLGVLLVSGEDVLTAPLGSRGLTHLNEHREILVCLLTLVWASIATYGIFSGQAILKDLKMMTDKGIKVLNQLCRPALYIDFIF